MGKEESAVKLKKNQNDILRPEIIKRVLIWGILLLVLAAAKCSFFSNLHICPATPDLLVGAVAAITLLDSKKSAAIFAVAAGIVSDALGGAGISLSPVVYLLIAALVAVLGEKMLPAFPSYAVLLIPAILARELIGMAEIFVLYRSLPTLEVILGTFLPEAICTFIFCLGLYPLIKLCSLPLGARNKFSF